MAWTWQSLRGRLLTVQASPNVYRFKGTVIRPGGTKEQLCWMSRSTIRFPGLIVADHGIEDGQ
jgi:hypothetical protein